MRIIGVRNDRGKVVRENAVQTPVFAFASPLAVASSGAFRERQWFWRPCGWRFDALRAMH